MMAEPGIVEMEAMASMLGPACTWTLSELQALGAYPLELTT